VLSSGLSVHNRTGRDIDRVTAAVEFRRASYDASKTLGLFYSCSFTIHAIAAHSSGDVKCGDTQRNYLTAEDQAFLDAGEQDMYPVWVPRSVVYSDGEELKYEEHEADKALLWGFYRVE
jgi:hypothetical protein